MKSHNRIRSFAIEGFGSIPALSNNIDLSYNPSTCKLSQKRFADCSCAELHDGDGTFCRPRPNALHDCKRSMLDNGGITLDCSKRGLYLAPHNVPMNVIQLNLGDNKIERFPLDFFSNLQSLEV